MTDADIRLEALHASAKRLRGLVLPMSDDDVTAQSYAAKWTISDVLSHLGSGAFIMRRRLEDGLAGRSMPDGFAPSVWDEWNAKSPRSKTDDGLASDRELMSRLDAVSDEERSGFHFSLGPFEFDFAGLIGLRLNEHTLHTWDIEVGGDPAATLAADSVELVVDNLEFVAGFTAKPTGSERTIVVRTTEPSRAFAIALSADAAGFAPAEPNSEPDVTLPAESFVRLVYGRLDPAHSPAIDDPDGVVDELRRVFPGP